MFTGTCGSRTGSRIRNLQSQISNLKSAIGNRQSPIALVVGLALAALAGCQTEAVAPALAPQDRRDMENRSLNLLLTAAESEMQDVSCNAIEALVRVAPRAGLPVFRKATVSTMPIVRYAGFVALGELHDRPSLAAIKAAVADEHPHVRLAAAFAACRCGKDGFARVLFDALKESPDEGVRAEAASLIGRLQDKRAVPRLRAALTWPGNAKSKHVMLAIRGALASLGDTDSLHELINYSQGDPASRTDALLILADLGNPDARDALRYRLLGASEEYDEARLIAARGLAKLGYRDGYDLATKMLTFTDGNANPTPENPSRTFPVRSMAIHALAEIGDPRSLPALRTIAASSEDPRLQVAACYAICRILPK